MKKKATMKNKVICFFNGHVSYVGGLPFEEVYGCKLYAYNFCQRCGDPLHKYRLPKSLWHWL